ncbi:DUF6318 family protein [Ornithinimicrobium murale]|uniref:DUF6318 family protein n=1 Tax=Ornithinimicrobium murale TaxID=1050153 RepID=UPI0013B4078E|nr:DUF6318 family protein [Ornithinimicrobium murale]
MVETSSAPDVSETTEASGPPELPDEATEDSEAGAEAFAVHYVELMNYAAMAPDDELIGPLATDGCDTCAGFEGMMASYVNAKERAAGPLVDVGESRAREVGEETIVFLESVEKKPATLSADGATATESGDSTPFTMVLTVTFDEGQWLVSEIQVQQ